MWSPDPAAAQGCTYDVTGTLTSVGAEQANALVTVTTQAGCAWTAAGNGAWLNPATPSGTGSATVTFGVLANPDASLREGSVTLAGVPVTITQAGASCNYSVTGTWTSVGPEQANAVVSVTTATGCTWTAAGNGSWLNPATSSGSGSAAVTFGVLANTAAAARTGTVTLAGVAVTITQAGGCSYQVTGLLTNVGPQQANAQVGVTTQAGCAWNTASGAAWLTPGVASGSGSATLTVGVLPYTGTGARTGLVTVAAVAVPITQTGRVFGDVDGDGTADVSIWRPGDGTWQTLTTASSYQSSVTTAWGSGASGDQPVPGDYDGDGRLDAAVWRGATGVWSIRLAASGQPITVTWGSAGAGDVPVPADYDGDGKADPAVWRGTTGDWFLLYAATAYHSWQQYTLGRSELGHRAAPLDVDGDGEADLAVWGAIDGPDGGWWIRRSSQGYAATQHFQFGSGAQSDRPVSLAPPAPGTSGPPGVCTYDVTPLTRAVGAGSEAFSFNITTQAGCAWEAETAEGPITISSAASGVGSGTVSYAVTANSSSSQRSGSLTIAGHVALVTQAGIGGPTCTYAVTPTTTTVGYQGGTLTLMIDTQPGCSWTADPIGGFLVLASPVNGTGSGPVTYSVQNNTAPEPRAIAVDVAGRTVSVSQLGNGPTCTYTLAGTPTTSTETAVALTTTPGCAWSFTAPPSSEVVADQQTGMGEATVLLSRLTSAPLATGTSPDRCTERWISGVLVYECSVNAVAPPLDLLPMRSWCSFNPDPCLIDPDPLPTPESQILSVRVVKADEATDNLEIELVGVGPDVLTVTLIGPQAAHVLVSESRLSGTAQYSLSEKLASVPAGTYGTIRAVWRGAVGELQVQIVVPCVPAPPTGATVNHSYVYNSYSTWPAFQVHIDEAALAWNQFVGEYTNTPAFSLPAGNPSLTIVAAPSFMGSPVWGQFFPETSSIALNPDILFKAPEFMKAVIMHELGHARGYRGHPPIECPPNDTIMTEGWNPLSMDTYPTGFGPGDRAAARRDAQ
jgi:hypothetical protein